MTQIIVKQNNDQIEYPLVFTSGGTLLGKFLDWENNCPTNVEITYNSLNSFHILQIDVVKQSHCRGEDRICNELQIKAENGPLNTGAFLINNEICDLKVITVIYNEYTQDEIAAEEHKKMLCSVCYNFGDTPDTKEGSILIGN